MSDHPSGRERRNKVLGKLVSPLLLIVILGTLAYFARDDLREAVTRDAAPVVSSGPTTTPGAMVPDAVVDLAAPFTGTHAAGWANGDAGIVAPPAAPIGKHTAAQVADAYARVRTLLIATRLDRAVIERHDLAPVLALISPDERAHLLKLVREKPGTAYAQVTRIAPGFRLLPVAPKVSGRMWAAPGPDGELIVHTDYLFAYAFHADAPKKLADVHDIVSVDRFQAAYPLYVGDQWTVGSRGLAFGEISSYHYSMACGALKRGELAPAHSEQTPGGTKDDPRKFYDPAAPLPSESTCPG
ncbi:hypothetical protein [Herbihabitans rhizosphaerae]|uniref:hypothetical protein n=1 Tax=Herbihabitans rhizosphaerae TaxID=1872711 RepID=UPI00102CD239|nr:hypothetical protein [Herbihabitans rhizosphaerae]